MALDTGFVLAMAAAFLLLGIALSPLAWVALSHRRTRSERETDQRFLDLNEHVRALRGQLHRCESALAALEHHVGRGAGDWNGGGDHRHPHGPHWLGRRTSMLRVRPGARDFPHAPGAENSGPDLDGEQQGPNLISVPTLADAPNERQAALDGLAERHAAIWNLRDAGASADTIARATGQPIGQVELILGLRRQIDGVRTTRPHAGQPHE